MCMYCERRTDIKFGWKQPKLPYHNNPPSYNLSGNVLENEEWDAEFKDKMLAATEVMRENFGVIEEEPEVTTVPAETTE